MAYTYEQGKIMQAEFSAETKKWGDILQTFPRGIMGLVTDEANRTAEYQEAKRQFDYAFAKERLFNSGFIKRYKKEYNTERRAKREALKQKGDV